MSKVSFAGKRMLVAGAGVSGVAVAQILQRKGALVTLQDAKTLDELGDRVKNLQQQGIKLALGQQNEILVSDFDYIVVSPGISIYSPLVLAAEKQGVEVISEVEVAYRLCPAPILAITGTNGKTTTTTLVGEMVKTTGKRVVVGGNIGKALSLEVEDVTEQDLVVAEISSFQLEGARTFRPVVAAVLNVTPDHLDRHKTMQNYMAMKSRIFTNQLSQDYVVANYDDPLVRDMMEKAVSQVVYFSRKTELEQGVFLKDDIITIAWQGKTHPVCSIHTLRIIGSHNVENALAACGMAFFAGVQVSDMAAVLGRFEGVEHRIERVATVRQVTYYNDSKATNPESSIKALEAFRGHVILLAGGRDKHTDLTEFMKLVKEKVDCLILIGEAGERFAQAAREHQVEHIERADSMAAAVQLAHDMAQPHQVVLLSPACASYDMFRNYEERGRVFKELVHRLSS